MHITRLKNYVVNYLYPQNPENILSNLEKSANCESKMIKKIKFLERNGKGGSSRTSS